MSTRFLVIPDLHFLPPGAGAPGELKMLDSELQEIGSEEAQLLVKRLLKATEGQLPHAVIALGDLTSKMERSGFQIAVGFFRQLKKDLAAAQFFFTPGNHDVRAAPKDTPLKFISRISEEKAYEGFNEFLASVGEERGSEEHPYSFFRFIPGDRGSPEICLLGLNSSRLERPACLGLGYVGLDQILKLHRDILQKRSNFNGVFGIAITHFNALPAFQPNGIERHFPDIFDRIRKQSSSFWTDSAQVLSLLSDLKFGVLLHGHSHQRPLQLRIAGHSLYPEGDHQREAIYVNDAGKFWNEGKEEPVRRCLWMEISPHPWAKGCAKLDSQFIEYDKDKYKPLLRLWPHDSLYFSAIDLKGTDAAKDKAYRDIFLRMEWGAKQFSKAYREWMKFFGAREIGGGEWERQKNSIERGIFGSGGPSDENRRRLNSILEQTDDIREVLAPPVKHFRESMFPLRKKKR